MPIRLHVFDDCFCTITVALISMAHRPNCVLCVPSQKKFAGPYLMLVGSASKAVQQNWRSFSMGSYILLGLTCFGIFELIGD